MIFLTIAVLLTVAATTSADEVPEFIHICRRKSPDLNDCVTESIHHLRPYLMKGIPDLNVPSLEPFFMKELVAVQSSALKIAAKDINTYGASDFTISNMKIDLDSLILSADVSLPHLYVDGQYEIDGKILLLQISGSGPWQANFTGCEGTYEMHGELRKNDAGEEHLYCKDLSLKFTVASGNIHFDNLFGGDRVLGDVVNTAVNNNFASFVKELKPLVETALSTAFQDIANNIVKPYSYKQLLPNS